MNEEIRLRDLILLFWNSKVLIASITAASLILGLILNYFVIPTSYQATAIVRVQVEEDENSALSAYTEMTLSDVTLQTVISKLNLKYGIDYLRDNVSIALLEDTSVFKISAKGTDAGQARNVVNALAQQLATSVEIAEESNRISKYYTRLLEIDDELPTMETEYKVLDTLLKQIPDKAVLNKNVLENEYIKSILEQMGINESLDLSEEELNSVYTSIQLRHAETLTRLDVLKEEKKLNQSRIAEINKKIAQLENNELFAASDTSLRYLERVKSVQINPSIEAVVIGPRTVFNSVVFMLIGLIFSVLVVLFRALVLTHVQKPQA